MPERFRQHVGATGKAVEREYAAVRGLITFWDMSEKLNKNDYRKKLGKADKTRGAAIVDIDQDTGVNVFADGIHNKRRKRSIFPIDPDSFVLRLFGKQDGDGIYGSWAVRLKADHTQKMAAKEHHGTIIQDNERSQQWDFISTALWVAEVGGGTKVKEKELQFNGAGYLADLYDEVTIANSARGQLSVNIARNAGFITDGSNVGQWSHLITFPSGAGGGTQAAAGIGSARPTKGREAVLRGDVGFLLNGKVGAFRDEPDGKPGEGDKNDERRLVKLFLDDPFGGDDRSDPADDPASDHAKIPKEPKQKIHGVVRIPKPGG